LPLKDFEKAANRGLGATQHEVGAPLSELLVGAEDDAQAMGIDELEAGEVNRKARVSDLGRLSQRVSKQRCSRRIGLSAECQHDLIATCAGIDS
jgi:hypothetical protein